MGGSVGIAGPWLYDTEIEEYLTITELSSRIKMAPGTIRNLVWKNELIENVHYAQDHGRHLLNGPSIFPSNTRGFAKFVQLILIAIFIGWAASRFKRK